MPKSPAEVLGALKLQTRMKISQVQWDHAGVLPSQMLQFVMLCHRMGVTHVAESGRRNGFSTRCIAECGFALHSVDWQPVDEVDDKLRREFPNAYICAGDGMNLVEPWIAAFPDKLWGVLLDGPKGDKAIELALRLFKRESVKVVAIHDVQNGTERLAKILRVFYGRVTMSTTFDITPEGQSMNREAAEIAEFESPQQLAMHAPLCMITA